MSETKPLDIEDIVAQFVEGKISEKELKKRITELIKSKLERGGIKYESN